MLKMNLTAQYPIFKGDYNGQKFFILFGEHKEICEKTKEVRHQIYFGKGHNYKISCFGIPIKYNRKGQWPCDFKTGGFTQTQKEMVEEAYMRLVTEIDLEQKKRNAHKNEFDRLALEINPRKITIEVNPAK